MYSRIPQGYARFRFPVQKRCQDPRFQRDTDESSELLPFEGMTPMCFLGETVTPPTDTESRLRIGAATLASTLMMSGIGAGVGYVLSKPSNRARYQKNGAIVGAVVDGAILGGTFSAPMLCGLMSPKSEQDEIERIQRPMRIVGAVSSATAALVGGVLGSMISKSHPVAGAAIGAAIGSSVTLTAQAATACPQLPNR